MAHESCDTYFMCFPTAICTHHHHYYITNRLTTGRHLWPSYRKEQYRLLSRGWGEPPSVAYQFPILVKHHHINEGQGFAALDGAGHKPTNQQSIINRIDKRSKSEPPNGRLHYPSDVWSILLPDGVAWPTSLKDLGIQGHTHPMTISLILEHLGQRANLDIPPPSTTCQLPIINHPYPDHVC